jgi:hypothetical protein
VVGVADVTSGARPALLALIRTNGTSASLASGDEMRQREPVRAGLRRTGASREAPVRLATVCAVDRVAFCTSVIAHVTSNSRASSRRELDLQPRRADVWLAEPSFKRSISATDVVASLSIPFITEVLAYIGCCAAACRIRVGQHCTVGTLVRLATATAE